MLAADFVERAAELEVGFRPAKSNSVNQLKPCISRSSLFQVMDDCFRAGTHSESSKNIFDVTMHRPDTDAHSLRDFLVHATFTEKLHHLPFAVRQLEHSLVVMIGVQLQ
jgi:hypothetical protein